MAFGLGLRAFGSRKLNRMDILRQGLDFQRMVGLEIGPLACPVVRKSEGDVIYVDHANKADLASKYIDGGTVDVDALVDVDAIWGEQSLSECLGGRRVDYVIASHVAEHVPDLVTWLMEIQDVLRPDGKLRLVLPDKRFSFDYLREETRIADLLAAYLLRARRPQVRDVLDFRLHFAPTIDGWGIYEGRFDPATLRPSASPQFAMELAARVRDSDAYDDIHCWVFTPRGFATLMQRLAEYGLLRMACARFTDSSYPLMEFYPFLTPCDDQDKVIASWRDTQSTLAEPLPGSAAAARQVAEADAAEAERQRVRDMEQWAQELLGRVDALTKASEAASRILEQQEIELRNCRRDLRSCERELHSCRARAEAMELSTSWRITGPMRRLKLLFGA